MRTLNRKNSGKIGTHPIFLREDLGMLKNRMCPYFVPRKPYFLALRFLEVSILGNRIVGVPILVPDLIPPHTCKVWNFGGGSLIPS